MKRIAVFFSLILAISLNISHKTEARYTTDRNDHGSFAEDFAVAVDLGEDFTLVPSDNSADIESTVTGSPVTYNWTQISGPNTATLTNRTTPTLTASNLVADKTYTGQNRPEGYIFRLTVTDVNGNTAYDEINIKLAVPNLGSKLETWTYQKVVTGWDTSPFLPYRYNSNGATLPFRIMYPKDYTSKNDGKKYPLIMFTHGRGERGTDNDFQLKNGGKMHRDAVLSGKFDGFVLFPQYPINDNSAHPTAEQINSMTAIVQELILNEKVDANRVHVHGLSTGSRVVWETIRLFPKVYASAMPMAWCEDQYSYDYNVKKYLHLPLWISQGGKDGVALPEKANRVVREFRKAGGDVRYLYFPNNGHNAWDDTYKNPDFFPFFMRHTKMDILVYQGQTSFCAGDNINVKLGITPGFEGYEWQKDQVTIATGINEITATQTGDYRVRFRRGSVWTPWSTAVNINRNRAPSPAPSVTTRKKSVHLPSLDGSDEVALYAGTGYTQYQWYKNGQAISGANNPIFTVNQAGNYTVTGTEPGPPPAGEIPTEYRLEPARCESLPSQAIIVTTQNGPNAPKAPANLFAFTRSATSIELNFDDLATNETGFEIYRSTQTGGPYTIVDIIAGNSAANPVAYFDNNLQSGMQYYYKIRAINDDGASAYSNEAKAGTSPDSTPPAAPQDLQVSSSTLSSITLAWQPATDNVGVVEYLVYKEGNLIATTANTTYVSEGLVARTSYTFTVRAKDAAGNISSPSNQVSGASVNSGLFYSYYHVSGINTVNDIEARGTLIKTGYINNFSTSPKEQSDNYAFIYEGFITIKTAGEYTFFTSSDDGSRLFVNEQELVNNDGPHPCWEKQGKITLAPGAYPIRASFYQGTGDACFTVRWQGPGITKQLIPDAVLREGFNYPEGPSVPGNLLAAAASYKRINLSWQDNSTDETGFEIYRATKVAGPYTILYTTVANATTYADSTVTGSTSYYYKIRAIDARGASDYTAIQPVTTPSMPAAPAKPADLLATAVSSSSIKLDWTDASANETAFEIWRTTSAAGYGFTLVASVAANATSYMDLSLPGNTTLYYKIRAKGDGGYSGFTGVVNATTHNNIPVLQDILSRTVKFSTSLSFDVFVTDQDERDVINFEITDLPPFGSFVNNNDKTGTFTFAPDNSQGGAYAITVKAYDNAGGYSTKNFTLTVNNNATPVITQINNQEIMQGGTLSISVTATDEDGNAPLTLSLINPPAFVSIMDNGSGKGVLTIKPALFERPGVYKNIQVIAKDQQGGIGTTAFDLTVKGVDKDFTVSINFSHDGSAPFPWNNTGNAGTVNTLEKLTDEEGKNAGMKLKLRQDGGPSWSSSRSVVSAALYPEEVQNTRYWSYSGSPIYMTLSGLNPRLKYNFTFFGSEPKKDNRSCITVYTIGNKTGELQTANNSGEVVSLTNIVSDANGNVTIKVNRKSSAEWKMILNAMTVQGFYDDGSVPEAPSKLTATAPLANEVRLSWVDNSKSEDGFELLRGTNSNGPFTIVGSTSNNVTSLTDRAVVGQTTYFYKVRAFNSNGRSPESNIFTVITPNSAPVLAVEPSVVVRVGGTQTLDISATDPENDAVTLSVTGAPSFVTFTNFGNSTGVLKLAPTAIRHAGTYTVKVTATDSRSASVTQAIAITVISNEYDDAVYLNFGNNVAGTPWNDTRTNPAAGQSYAALKDALGNATSVSFTANSGWSGSGNKGVNTGGNTGVYADSVMKSYWLTTTSAGLTFEGLAAGKLYNFVFFASHQTTQEGTTAYTINGNTVQLNAANNSLNTVQLNGIAPNAEGKVTLTVSKTQYASGGYLGAVVIRSYQASTPLTPTQLTAKAVSRTEVKLQWKDNASNETAYRVYRSPSPYANYSLIATLGVDAVVYTDKTATKNSTYYYKVAAVGNNKEVYTHIASATTFEYLVYINFVGGTAKYRMAPAPWNNTKASPTTDMSFNNLKNDAGSATSVDLVIENWETVGFDNNLGINTGNNSGIYPDAVLESFYFIEYGEFAQFKVKELDPNYHYSFIFLGSGDPNIDLFQTAGNLTTRYKIGQTVVTQNALGNKSETVQINGIVPDGNNEIAFEIRSETYANYAIFNSLVIGAYTPSEMPLDEMAPTTPANLIASKIAPNSITLQWDASTDNGSIAAYELYNGKELVTFVNGNTTVQKVTNTLPGTEYNFSVVAVDEAGNKSPVSEMLTLSYEVMNGVDYAYYESGVSVWNAMPDFAAATPIKTGTVANFSLSPKERLYDFGFRFYSYVNITTAGDYTFYTRSNTGSKLYVDGVEVVSNDVANDSGERSGTVYGLTSGWHEVVVDYRNTDESDLLEVSYAGPGIAKVKMPDNALFRTAIVSPVGQPVEFVAVKATLVEQQVKISWSTASEVNNDYFTVEKSYDLNNFVSIGKVDGAGDSHVMQYYSLVDRQLKPGNIYYRIRQTDFDGKEKYSVTVHVNTDAIFKLTEATLFPNPAAADNLHLKVLTRDLENQVGVTATDLMGKVVYREAFDAETLFEGKKLTLRQGLPAGIYIVKISQGKQVLQHRIIIQ